MALRIGIALFEDAEELDWAGPYEVLAAWALNFPDDDVEVFTLAPGSGPVRCAKGLTVLADYTWASAPPIDVLVYPGGQGTRRQLGDDSVRHWIHGVAASAQLMTSVCTGALVFADAGLLDGKPATTHWSALDLLRSLGSDIDVRPDDRYVHSGSVITAAGGSAGIDMAVYLVTVLASEDRAREVKRYIQYDPQPPI